MAMAVVPAPEKAPLGRIREVVGARKVEIATEDEFRSVFPDCELGAMPPFGNLYGLEVYVAESLSTDREIAFNAGSFVELVRLAYKDFERLVRPKVV
jgi:Ala-tRNA(Pro) deacylase